MVDLQTVKTEAEAVAAADATKAKGWLARNWYPFMIGGACGVVVGWIIAWAHYKL